MSANSGAAGWPRSTWRTTSGTIGLLLEVLLPEVAAAFGHERFLLEIRLTARLDHPHILALLDSGEADGLLYYVMPYVEGESLRDRLNRQKQLPLEDALRIGRQVASALDHAHQLGIAHRDIKPENVLLAGDHARVADFGIARVASALGSEALTQTGVAIGTPAYMSPEQATGAQDVDGRTDFCSLGCMVYEMLVGEAPYTGPTPQAVLVRKLREPVPSIRLVRPTIPEGVEAAVAKALASVPADRFTTPRAFADALERSAAETGAPATRGSVGQRRVKIGALPSAAILPPRRRMVGRRTRRIIIPDRFACGAAAPEPHGRLGAIVLRRRDA